MECQNHNYRMMYLKQFNLTEEQSIFICSYSFDRLDYRQIEQALKKFDSSKTYADVQRLHKECKFYVDEIQHIRNKFTKKRREDNNQDFEAFLHWYSSQVNKKKCHYCGVTQEELKKIFIEYKILPLNEKKKRSSGSLEIERIDSQNNSYHIDNLVLACPVCNNAKSNLIDENSWSKLFAPKVKEYYENLLKKIG